jgi:hypothetical protein
MAEKLQHGEVTATELVDYQALVVAVAVVLDHHGQEALEVAAALE